MPDIGDTLPESIGVNVFQVEIHKPAGGDQNFTSSLYFPRFRARGWLTGLLECPAG